MDFMDLQTEEYEHFVAARNSCRTAGALPANGMVYTFPHGCACYPLLRGFLGLAEHKSVENEQFASRLQTGTPFEFGNTSSNAHDADWPTYRHDVGRSGSTTAAGPRQLDLIWERQIGSRADGLLASEWEDKDGGRISSSTTANGMTYVAATDAHQVYALAAETGEVGWTFTAGGRVDCPPTLYNDLCLFGCRDGCFSGCGTRRVFTAISRYRTGR